MTKDKSVQNRIREVVDRIVWEFRPERVILFGSHAGAEADRTATWTCWW